MDKENNSNFFENITTIYKNKNSLLIYFLIFFLFFLILFSIFQNNFKEEKTTDKVLNFTLSNPSQVLEIDGDYYRSLIYNEINSKIDNYTRSILNPILTEIYKKTYEFNEINFFKFLDYSIKYKFYLKDKIKYYSNSENKNSKIELIDNFFKNIKEYDFEFRFIENNIINIDIYIDQNNINQKNINLITEFLYLTQNTFIETLEAKINKNHDKFTSLIKRELENNIYILETDYNKKIKKNNIVKKLTKLNKDKIDYVGNDLLFFIDNEFRNSEIKIIENKLNNLNNSLKNLILEKRYKLPLKFLNITTYDVKNKETIDINKNRTPLSFINYNTILISIILALGLSLIIIFTKENYKLYKNRKKS